MADFLRAIVETTHARVEVLRVSGVRYPGRTLPLRPFAQALDRRPRLAIIAEVKKASPSRGVIKSDFDPIAIAREYEAGGAAAISVLTEEKFFYGSCAYLQNVRAQTKLPVLRKDFIIDPLQIEESAVLNADAVLLIAAILADAQLAELHEAACSLNIEPLIEVHNRQELERALRLPLRMVGINNRDLTTFATDIAVTLDLAEHIPPEITIVSESGIATPSQARQLQQAGVRAILAGESLMRCNNPGALIKELACAGAD